MKNLIVGFLILGALSSFTIFKKDIMANWRIQINDKIITDDNIKLELLSKATVFKIEYLSENKTVSSRFIEVVNKEGVVLKKYAYAGNDTRQPMLFKADAFYDKLGDDEKLSIFYSEKGKLAKTEKIKLVEISF